MTMRESNFGTNFGNSTSNLGLVNGGRAAMVYIYIATFIGFFSSVISMAEIASLFVAPV